MKSNELMVGDWVYYHNKPYKVVGIRRSFGNKSKYKIELDDDINGIASIEFIQPIPLTPDILVEIGFEEGLTNCWHMNSVSITTFSTQNIFYYRDNRIEGIKYIHELQHALRLCGLNDLAENFKIE